MSQHPAFASNLPAHAHETGPPPCIRHLRDLELCDMFLDMQTLEDLERNVIQEANQDSDSESGLMMIDLITRLKGHHENAAANEMRELLIRLGLQMAAV